jgi:cell shape-determining protein MreC
MKKYSSIKKVNSPRSSSVKRLYVALAFVGLLLLTFALPRVFNVIGAVVLYPVHSVATWLRESESAFPYFVRDRLAIKAEVDALQAKIDAQTGMELSILRLEEENTTLRASLGESSSSRLLTRVVARPPFLPYDLLQIDKGTNDGVEIGAPVFLGQDVVIGVVSQVGDTYAFVELVSTPGFQSTVYVSGAHIFATMEGVGSGLARVRLAPSITVTVGDLVLMPSYEGGIFGQVSKIEKEPTQPEQYAYVALPETLQSFYYLTVGKKPVEVMTPEAAEESAQKTLQSTFIVPGIIDYQVASTTDSAPTSTVTTTAPVI